MIKGYATLSGTEKYFRKRTPLKKHRRKCDSFYCSPLSLGTHLGDRSSEHSLLYREAIYYALDNCINFIDTSLNYRGMKSERDVGIALDRIINKDQRLSREEIIISTKAGILPGDIDANLFPDKYIQEKLLSTGLIKPSDICHHNALRCTLEPKFYAYAVDESRKNLSLETIDIHYIHMPEVCMGEMGAENFYPKLIKLFSLYEDMVSSGKIRNYGFATWNGFLSPESSPEYLSLEKVIEAAESLETSHHFKFIMLPYNICWEDACKLKNQSYKGKKYSLMELAHKLGIHITTSAPLSQGNLPENISTETALIHSYNNNFISSITVGMKQISHINRNVEALANL